MVEVVGGGEKLSEKSFEKKTSLPLPLFSTFLFFFSPYLLLVVGGRQLSLLEGQACPADLRGLRERTNGSRGERVRLDLRLAALVERQLADKLGLFDVGDRVGDGGQRLGERDGLGRGSLLGRRDDVLDLLGGEGKLALQVLGEVLLELDVVREVLQRDRRLDRDVVDALGEQGRNKGGGGASVGPDGASVDDTGPEALALGEAVLLDQGGGGVLVGRAGHAQEVERDGGDGELDGPGVGLADVVVVGDQVDGDADGYIGGGEVEVGRRGRKKERRGEL